MMRALAAVALLALLPLAGGLQPREEAPLDATGIATAPTPTTAIVAPTPPPFCVLVLHAQRSGDHVALVWNECARASSYQVWRGPSAAELVPLIEVNHASHIDFPGGNAVYAVRVGDGPLSEAAAVVS
jgi:hypothetical protein